MTNDKPLDFVAELKKKQQAGKLKPSQVKDQVPTITKTDDLTQLPAELKEQKQKLKKLTKDLNDKEKHCQNLEAEKASLLAQLENYQTEQKAALKAFKDQEKLLTKKDQQLIAQDQAFTQQA